MSRKKAETWKTDIARQERKERLASQKDSSGQKKRIRSYSLTGRIIGIAVALVIILSLAVWALSATGLMQRWVTAVKIGETRLSVADVNTVFGFQAVSPSRWNLGNVFTDAGQQLLENELSLGEEGLNNYRDHIRKYSLDEWKATLALYEEGQRNGFVMSDEKNQAMEASIEQFRASIEQQAAQYQITVPVLLKSTYGPGSRFAEIENYLKISFYAEAYLSDYSQNVDITETEMEEAYQESKDMYDMVSYHAVTFISEYPEQVTDEVKETVESHTAVLANKMKDDLAAGKDFFVAALEHMEDTETKKLLSEEPAAFIHQYRTINNIKDTELRTWLFEAGRQAGETTVIESTSEGTANPNQEAAAADQTSPTEYKSYTVVKFDGRSRQNVKPFTTRHILFSAEEDETITDAKLKAEAELVLAEYNRGDKTEEAFAELAKKHSKDSNAAEGGLYEKTKLGQFVEEYETWALDPARQEGDVGLVKTQFGYHLIYYIGSEGEEAWKDATGEKILTAKIAEWREALEQAISYKESSFGINMVGKIGLFKILFG
ncbi:MAG: peptidylprolyl isomerase [Saccharofermentanales bacterium]|jgi:parvulin-like peptidyl-prolyl isomerase